jgi:hypothetical protein
MKYRITRHVSSIQTFTVEATDEDEAMDKFHDEKPDADSDEILKILSEDCEEVA